MHWIALQPQPDTGPAPVAQLADAVTSLGWWALQFTPKVTRMEDVVLLEVSASERLWGGREALLRHILSSDKPVCEVRSGQGDTSLLALGRLLAGKSEQCAANALPLGALTAARPHLQTLARLGCTRWGQLRALPRAGLVRRFGAELLAALDQAYGNVPEVHRWLTLPAVFEARLELPTPVDSAPALLFAARRLLGQLQVWLGLRQLGVLTLELVWRFDVRRHGPQQGSLVVRSAVSTQDTAHWLRLLGEYLAHAQLDAPVQSLRLRSLETTAWVGRSASLLSAEPAAGDSVQQLIERLSARLGAQQIVRLQACADHRPEQMQVWRCADGAARIKDLAGSAVQPVSEPMQSTPPPGWAGGCYPTWLLPKPLRLIVRQQRPQYQGPLTLLAGPWRLESGWWSLTDDAPAVLRDYYVARSLASPRLWIFCERLGGAATAWYVHGFFA